MKSQLAFLIVVGLLLVIGWLLGRSDTPVATLEATSDSTETSVIIGDKTFLVELARTTDEQARGLSGRDRLVAGRGMLFPFNPPEQPSFWMKDMRFSIDIIWIADDRVADVSSNLPVPATGTAPSDLPLYAPSVAVDYALEVMAGQAASIKIGEPVIISETTGS